MSTILKALRRLEEEKAANEEPRPLREQIARAPGALRARRTGWVAAAIALVLGIGAGGGVIWWLFADAERQVAATAPVTPAAPAAPAPPAAAPAPAPLAHAPVPGPPDQAFASDVEMVDRPEALPRLADTEPVQPGPVQPKLGTQRPVDSSSAAERARQAALAEYQAAERARRGLPPEVIPPSPPQPAEPVPVIPAESPVAAAVPPAPEAAARPAPAPAPVVQATTPPAPAPRVAEVKPAAKPAAPKPAAPRAVREEAPPAPPPPPSIAISVEKTQWHPLADRRIAWVRAPGETDSQRVVEGDVVDGLIVSAIEPSGVVFERDGEKIRRVLGQP